MLTRAIGLTAAAFFSLVLLSGCSTAFKKKEPEPTILDTVNNPVSNEEAEQMVSTGGKNWAFGHGMGDTVAKVATSIVFPPYLIYLVGNGAIELAGYNGAYVTDALPDPYRSQWNGLYDSVTSIPGRTVATLSGTEFRTQERINAEGGFWGLKSTAVASNGTDELQGNGDEGFKVASTDGDVRNDLYGTDRTGS